MRGSLNLQYLCLYNAIGELSEWPWKAVIDLKLAFWHLPLDEHQRKYFGFVTTFGDFRWKCATFGFLNARPPTSSILSTTASTLLWRLNGPQKIRSDTSWVLIFILVQWQSSIYLIMDVLTLLVRSNCTVVPSSISFGTVIYALGKEGMVEPNAEPTVEAKLYKLAHFTPNCKKLKRTVGITVHIMSSPIDLVLDVMPACMYLQWNSENQRRLVWNGRLQGVLQNQNICAGQGGEEDG